MVDEAKAFCPECGNVLVEEKQREEESAYESMEGTMQFGQTMYNQMLSDMGLNISDAPNKKLDTPLASQVAEPNVRQPVQPVHQILQPIETGVSATPAAQVQKKAGGTKKWVIVGGIGAVLLLILLVAAILIGVALWSRYS